MDKKLKPNIDIDIQKALNSSGISYQIDDNDKISIHEMEIDEKAQAAMLYLIPKKELPEGEMQFLVVSARWIFGVFHFGGKAAIIEAGTKALESV